MRLVEVQACDLLSAGSNTMSRFQLNFKLKLMIEAPTYVIYSTYTCFNLYVNFFGSEAVQEYGVKMTDLCRRIVQMILMSLGNDFDKKFNETEFSKCNGYLRIINYTPPKSSQEVEGLGKHTDMSCITILYPDDINSLQVRSKEGKWMNIEPCKDSVVVNIGDMFEAWSNAILRSSEHRIVLSKPRNRLSLAFFWTFEDDKMIFAPKEMVGDGNNRVFRPFICRDYVRFREFDDKDRYDKVGNTVRDFAGCTGAT